MMLRVARGLALLFVVPAALVACVNPFDGRCGVEHRSTVATTRFPESIPNNGFAQLTLSEAKEDPPTYMSLLFISPELKGHITSVTLTDGRGRILVLPPTPGSFDNALDIVMMPYVGSIPFGDLFTDASQSRVVLTLTTDLADRPMLQRTMGTVAANDWARPYCD